MASAPVRPDVVRTLLVAAFGGLFVAAVALLLLASPVGATGAAFVENSAPAISIGGADALADVGDVLTASPGDWTPAPTKTTYQWYRGSSKLSGKTTPTYTAVAADAGQTLKVTVTVSATGYVTKAVGTTVKVQKVFKSATPDDPPHGLDAHGIGGDLDAEARSSSRPGSR